MTWWNRYVGLPFKLDGRDRSGVDCYGLICLVYQEELGIELNPFSGIFVDKSPKTMLEVAAIMNRDRDNWLHPTKIREFDMLQLRTGRHAFHVGIALDDKRMLHVEAGTNAVIENLRDPLWKNRVEWIYRHKYMNEYVRIHA